MENTDSLRTFAQKLQVYYATLHLVQLSIQALMDMASGMISLIRARKPKEYSDMAEILAEEGVLSMDEVHLLRDMIRFRNLLIHVYAKLDPAVAYKLAKERAETDVKALIGRFLKVGSERGLDKDLLEATAKELRRFPKLKGSLRRPQLSDKLLRPSRWG